MYAAPPWAPDAELGVIGMPIPEFTLTIGSKAVALRPANVTLQRNTLIGGNCCLANVGRDVLAQAQSVSIDFAAMTLLLQETK